MSEKLVLIRSSMRLWDYILLLIAGIGLLVASFLVDKSLTLGLQILGGLSIVTGGIGLQWRIATRQWIRVEEDFFTIVDRHGESDYDDVQVQSLALKIKHNYSEGVETSISRTLLLWVGDDEDVEELTRLELKTTLKPADAADPLADFIERLSKRVLKRARELLASGSTFAGDGWVLEQRNLVVAAKPKPLHSRLDDIVMTGVVDKKLGLWKKGQDEVWARIDIDSVNAYILQELIDERLEEQGEADANESADGLGRIIFERRSRTTTVVIMVLGIIALILMGIGFIVAGVTDRFGNGAGLIIGGVGCFAGAIGCVLGIIHCRIAVFRCHQFGLVSRGLAGERELRYEDVEAFTFQATRHFHNGVYTGTNFLLDFEPIPEQRTHRIRYGGTASHVDEELENLRTHIADVIGARMRREIHAGRSVLWTPGLTFKGQSLIYKPSGLFASKEPIKVPLAEIESYNMHQGQCQLFRKGQKKVFASVNMHARNFFPGFHCMLGLINVPEAAYDVTEEVEDDVEEVD